MNKPRWYTTPEEDWSPADRAAFKAEYPTWSAASRAEYRAHQEKVKANLDLHQPLTGEPVIVPPTRSLPPNFGRLRAKPKRAAGDVDRLLAKLGVRSRKGRR